ncbi:MAG: type II toxin-antitoxin system VapC family toxin [Candidatus Accumulibacter sp.]|jgi:predicted nucleic-acid-binding protein|nr:type II toxin-antitoxin system VapC family toxin [Accumulibacter sp.]
MSIVIDTNILLRYTVGDDPAQAAIAERIMESSSEIVIPTQVFCEYVWTLRARYKQPKEAIAEAIRAIVATDRIVVNDDEVQAGLQMMEDGGDFADGVTAYAGSRMASGPAVFASFDKQAVKLLVRRGLSALVPD